MSNPTQTPKSKKRSKNEARIEENIENKSVSTTYVDPKTVFEPHPDPEISPLGPQQVKITPKLDQNQNSELKET